MVGYETRQAYDGTQALEIIEKEEFDNTFRRYASQIRRV